MITYPIVHVVWDDHRDKSSTDWTPMSEAIEELEHPVENHSFGFLIRETDQYVIVATTVDILSEKQEVAYAIKILKGTISEMKVL